MKNPLRPIGPSGLLYLGQVRQGVDSCAVDADLEVAVVAGGSTGGTRMGNGLVLIDLVAGRDQQLGIVTVIALHAIAVVDNDQIAVGALIARPDDGAAIGCRDGSAVRKDIRIPLLSEYIAICKKYGKKCVLELKNSFTEEELVKITEEVNAADYADGMIYISFPLQNCLVLRRMLPDCEIQFLMDAEITEDTVKFLKDYRFDLDVHCRQLTKEKVELLHANGIKVNCWTCNTEEEANKLIEMGVDFITTNILE